MKEKESGKLVWIDTEDIIVVGSYDLKVFVEDINEKSYHLTLDQPLSIKEWINAMEIFSEIMRGYTPKEVDNKEAISYQELRHIIKTSDRWIDSPLLSDFPLRHSITLRAEAKIRKLHEHIIDTLPFILIGTSIGLLFGIGGVILGGVIGALFSDEFKKVILHENNS